MFRTALIIIGFIACFAWALGYQTINGLACAFSGPGGAENCRIKAPWELQGDDLMTLVILPGAAVALIFLLAWRVGRPRKTN